MQATDAASNIAHMRSEAADLSGLQLERLEDVCAQHNCQGTQVIELELSKYARLSCAWIAGRMMRPGAHCCRVMSSVVNLCQQL